MSSKSPSPVKAFGVRHLPEADPEEVLKLVEEGLMPRVPEPDALDGELQTSHKLKEGDLVTFFGGYDQTATTRLVKGERLSNRLGDFYFDDVIGGEFGMKVWDRNNPKWMAILPASPEMHMQTLRHRTQILYTMDMSYSIIQMGLKNGSRVAESGTGSGAMSYFLSRTVGEEGRVFTFEYHPKRYAEAVADCKLLNLTSQLRNFERNAYKDGFEVSVEQGKASCEKIGASFDENQDTVSSENPVDAVFLDLPEPWQALDHADSILCEDGVLVVFSPCVEQVLKTCQLLEKMGWDAHLEVVEAVNFTWNGKVFGAGKMATKAAKRAHTPDRKNRKKQKISHDEGKSVEEVDMSQTSPSVSLDNPALCATARAGRPCLLDRDVPVSNVWPNLTPTPGHTGFLIHTRKACQAQKEK